MIKFKQYLIERADPEVFGFNLFSDFIDCKDTTDSSWSDYAGILNDDDLNTIAKNVNDNDDLNDIQIEIMDLEDRSSAGTDPDTGEELSDDEIASMRRKIEGLEDGLINSLGDVIFDELRNLFASKPEYMKKLLTLNPEHIHDYQKIALPAEVQEFVLRQNPANIKYLKDLDQKVKKKYSNVGFAGKFGMLDNETV